MPMDAVTKKLNDLLTAITNQLGIEGKGPSAAGAASNANTLRSPTKRASQQA